MPGLQQLKQFTTDILTLGDEVQIRAARGEKPSTLPIPSTVEDRDDKEDFVLGLPEISEEQLAQADAAAAEKEKEANDFSDITGDDGDEESAPAKKEDTKSALPDVSDLLSSVGGDADLDDLDLSEFEEPKKPKEPEKPKEIAIEDMDLDALLAPTSKKEPEPEPIPQPVIQEQPKPAPQPKKSFEDTLPPELQAILGNKPASPVEKTPAPDEIPDLNSLNLTPVDKTPAADAIPDLEDISALNKIPSFTETPAQASDAIPSFDEISSAEEIPSLDNIPAFDEQTAFNNPAADSIPPIDDISSLDAIPSFDEVPAADTASSASDLSSLEGMPSFDSFDEKPAASSAPSAPVFDEITSLDDIPTYEETPAPSAPAMDEMPSFGDIPTFDETPSGSESPEPSVTDTVPDFGTSDFGTSDFADSTGFDTESFDTPDFGDTGNSDNFGNPEDSVPEESTETFDTSSIDGMDFSNEPDIGSSGDSDFALGNFGEGDDVFNIPGFSDTTTANITKAKPNVATPDFSNAKIDKGKPKNTFTDAEYEKFQKNLNEYPLNVRIALEDLVVKNEFTDDAVFEILEKVLKKVPAKQLASDLEKMLDISIDVPRDYERRTAEEYEAYKKSLEYQLKNKIIPGAIISAGAAILVFCIWIILKTFIIVPAQASHYYKKGWACLQREEYPQSEMEFDKAISFKPVEKWFFKYADGYRRHKQYERSVMMYRAILQRFDHNKQAGLLWADMELNDRYNYEEVERILKREVLDYYINDPDAMLVLGDDYLEWGTEKDPSKFDLALEQYGLLLQLYGGEKQNLYLSRMMRYYIRTDDLKQVLQYKEYFFPIKKGLDAKDLTELSGYLFDKRYGKLSQSEEPLRIQIEDVRTLLERAVKADMNNPVAIYNFGRYFVETANYTSALNLLQSAKDIFEKQEIRNKRDTYKYINTHRLMGELYLDSKKHILAEQTFADGINLFEKENESSGFESDENIGKLYADLADMNYFLSGNMDYAKTNYIKAINNKNDTASIRYRVGYIQYIDKEYSEALGSFIRAADSRSDDTHLLLALANTLSLRNDNYAAQGYYEKLLNILNKERSLHNVLLPQVREDQADIVDTYMKATNNLGVTMSRIAFATGNSKMNAEAIVNLTESMRAWDALTRNQETMTRLEGSNLPQQNILYLDHPTAKYSPEIFTAIPRTLSGEKTLEQ